MFLTGLSVLGENLAIDTNGGVGGSEKIAVIVEANFKSGAPFGETKPHLIVFGETAG